MNIARAESTIKPPINVIVFGLSPMPHHTQSGPNTVSDSMIKLTVEDFTLLAA